MTDAEEKPREFWVAPKLYSPIDPVEAEYFHAFDSPGDPNRLEIHCIEFSTYQEAQEKIKHLEARVKKFKSALEFYSMPSSWGTAGPGERVSIDPCDYSFVQCGDWEQLDMRGGKRARAALKEDEEM